MAATPISWCFTIVRVMTNKQSWSAKLMHSYMCRWAELNKNNLQTLDELGKVFQCDKPIFSFVISSLFLRSSFVHPSIIVHRLSIDCPSIVHRFDGELVENQWVNFVDNMKGERRKSEVRTKGERRNNREWAKEDFTKWVVSWKIITFVLWKRV